MAKPPKHNHIPEIFCKTTFGQGDSSTQIWVQCRDCNYKTEPESQYGWPADKSLMRKALTKFQEK